MASEIEHALYGEAAEIVTPQGHVGNQCLLEFAICFDPRPIEQNDSETIVRLRVAPQEREYSAEGKLATFENAYLSALHLPRRDPEDNTMPWYIVSFYSRPVSDNMWHFVLDCEMEIRIEWGAAWPVIHSQ